MIHVRAITVRLFAPAAQTLKDKRQILRSLLDKIRHRFNVSIAEVEAQDKYQQIVIGVAFVSNSDSHARAMLEEVVRFIEEHADADIVSVEEE